MAFSRVRRVGLHWGQQWALLEPVSYPVVLWLRACPVCLARVRHRWADGWYGEQQEMSRQFDRTDARKTK